MIDSKLKPYYTPRSSHKANGIRARLSEKSCPDAVCPLTAARVVVVRKALLMGKALTVVDGESP